MSYFFSSFVALLTSFLLTGFLRYLALKYGLLNRPRKRDVHKKPMPRIGGIAIFLSFLIISILVFLFFSPSLVLGPSEILGISKHLLGIWIGGFFISFVMFFDDLFGLNPWQKLLAQIFVTFIAISAGIGIDKLSNPFGADINLNSVYIPLFTYHNIVYHFSLFSDLLTLIWLVGMMNVINFVDGVDGLAGGLSIIASITIFLLSISSAVNQPATAMISIILAGSACGFLIWNFPPAKIFMGDSGSMFLGFMLGVLPLISGGKLATVFLVLGFPIVDGLVVAIGRIVRHQNPLTTPDKTHLHHRFLAAGFSARQAILAMYLIAVAFGWVALRSSTDQKLIAAGILVLSLTALIILLSIVSKIRKSKKIKAESL